MDRRARFEALFDAHQEMVLAYLLRRAEQPADAADLLAEVFLTAWRRLDTIPPDHGGPWLIGVARKILSNHRRGSARRNQLADRLRQTFATITISADRPGGVREALAKLRQSDREILTLSHWDDLSPAEIGIVLGVSQGAVRVRLHRAKRRLRDVLQERESAHGSTGDSNPLRASLPE
jgi:RNA polymerase sigma-70 factor (ECF subfamily)